MAIQTKTVQTGDYAWKSWSNGYVISLTLTEESTDIAANTSLVSYLFTISNTNNNRFVQGDNSWTISIGGQSIAINHFDFNLGSNYTTQTIASGRITVSHNADGTLNMPYNVSVPNIQAQNKYGPPAMSLSGTWALTAIPRSAGISCPAGVIGKPVVLSIQNADSGFRYALSYHFGSLEATIAENLTQPEYTWTIPEAFYTQIPNAKRGVGSLTCRTYNGTTLVGEASCQLIADIDEAACLPILSVQVEDENPITTALTADANVLVRYYSDVRVTATVTAQNGASTASYTMTHNSKAYTDTSVLIAGAENGEFQISATDSRGLAADLTVTKQVIPYVKLTCNLESSKPDAEGNITLPVSGNYFSGSFGAEENKLTLQYRYKIRGTSWPEEEIWLEAEPEVSGNAYSAGIRVSGLNYQKAYTFQVRALDKLDVANAVDYTTRATPVFDWGEEDFAIHGDLQVDRRILLAGEAVLNTPYVRTYYFQTEGGVTVETVAEFMASCKENCAFITFLQGKADPYIGAAVGVVHASGNSGAFTLYDNRNGPQHRRLYGGKLYET